MSIPQADIDHILRMEGNADYARMKIATEFSKGKSVEEIAAFLQSSFHGGNGVVTENGRYSAWYAEDGIHIANGDAARYLTSAKVVSWQEAAERIGQLLTQGEYATNVELAEAPGHERAELAQSIWYLRQDLSEKARAQGYLSCLSDMRGGGFPEETARLAERLRDPAFREVLMDDFAQLRSDYREDRSLLRFHHHKPDKIEQGLRELSLPRREYRAEMAEIPAVQRFITEDEIAATLTRGSNIAGGKGRIYAYFKEKHSPKEQADFLKDEYGIGGRSHAVSGASHSGEDHSGKGISLKKQDCPEIQLNWANVAKRISELIRKDRFLTPEEKTQYEQLQRQTAARSAAWNDYNAVKEAHPDDLVLFQVGDFFELYGEDAKQAAELLEINLTTRNIPGAGRVEMCGVPSHNLEMYVEKLRDKYDVTIAEAPDFRGERHIYTLRSIDHEAEAAINAYEAEFGADGTRVFRDPAAEQVQPTVQEHLEHYRPVVMAAVSEDTAYRNACGHSDRENAEIECNAAVRRAVLNSKDMKLIRLFSDMPEFRSRLHREVFEGTHERLHDLLHPLTQDDIDDALRAWNGNIGSKHAVVRYMEQHGREKETAAWLAHEYGGNENNNLFIVRAGSPETVELTWPKVQRRIAQLIQSDNFYTERERDNFDDIDPIAVREALAQRGIVNGEVVDTEKLHNDPFIQRVMQDTEQISAQEQPTLDPADRFHVVSLDRGFRTLYAVWDDETHGYYVDADGVTEEFTSEWQAEAYRLELQGQAEQALTERAKGLISDFCRSEYGSEADFSDPAKVGVAYTTVTDDEIPVQVNIDLVNFRLERYLDDEHLETRQYASLQELISNELENLDFSDLIHVSDEDVEQYRWHEPEEAVTDVPETAPAPQREPFPYSVGDTVYLENGKPYIIESVGVFDITLSDPTLFYPISRAESRESFARLMERYPQPEKTAAENTAVPEKEPNPAYTEETVAVYPADKNNLPYDVEIRTLRFDEPEHDPPSAEPAEPEPPAMSEEEALLLEQEGRAALSEMGEFVPDFDDAISQAEIDEPPTHRHAVSISIDGEWQGFPSADAAEQAAYADFKAASHRNAQNFHITDDALGVGGAKAKFRANMAAIHLLKELEFEGLQASPEQQEILSRYVGWGGLADAFDESKDNWKDEFAELYAALSPEEYAAARASTLNAHYTSPTVIRAIYDAVENMGFQTGNILEPSMGVGNFFGMLPESMKSSRLYGVELDSITGRIAKQLYPKADITVAGFETTDRKDFFDLAVGNVPFGQYQVSDRAFDKLGFSIHNYFFAKALEQVRPGGVVAFVTSRYTMDAKDSAARVHAQLVDPGTDNMLKITSDGRKLGLDQRIINPDLPDDPNSKVNRCVDNIHRIWQDGQADRLTQLVFCDLSTPKTGATGAKAAKTAGGNLDSPELNAVERLIDKENPDEPGFTVYDDIREKLVARGIPREQIAFIHEANTETRKKELFAKVRSGQVRVLMGSTFKMGAGMNVQDRLVALHDLDCPWRPGDLEQRSGRIIRQGNRNKEVHIYRYVTESTFDAYLWQTVENKQKFISQIMTSKSPVRSCEDVDETALSYAEIKALCAGDERIKEKMDLDVDVARLKLMKASHQSQQFRLEDNLLRHFPEQIRQNESFVEGFTADMQTLAGHPHPVDGIAGMEVKGDLLTDKDNAGAAILEAFKDAKGMEPVPIGSYRGFAMSLTVEDFGRDFILSLKGKMNHRVTLGKDARGNLTRIDNALSAMPDRLQNVQNTLDALTAQMETAKAELGKPFPQEDELRTKSARLAELNAELNIDDRTPMEQMAEDAPAVQSAKAERPSVLAKLKAPLSQPCAEDKIRHRGKEER